MRTRHVGLRVEDPGRSPGFYVTLGYEVAGTVPGTEFGSLMMLKLPGDVFVSLELVHDPAAGRPAPPTSTISSYRWMTCTQPSLGSPATPSRLERRARPVAPMTSGPPGSPIPAALGSS